MTFDEFFTGYEQSREIFDHLLQVMKEISPVEPCVTKSQIAFTDRKAFAWTWIPARYLRGRVTPLVLTLVFNHRDASPRWKEVVEPSPGNFTHHLELYSVDDVDDQVRQWLQAAWESSTHDGYPPAN